MSWLIPAAVAGAAALYFARKKSVPPPPPNERVVVIGGSAGIGRCIAHIYAKRPGCRLVITSFAQAELDTVQKECQDLGSKECYTFQMDMTDEASLERTVAFVREKLGGCDTLLINAGTISTLTFEELLDADTKTPGHSSKAIDRVMKINTYGPIYTLKWFLPLMKESRGRIVVTSSAAGHTGAPSRALYCASKFAVNGFFESVRIELAQYGITIGLVCPMTVATDLRNQAADKVEGKSTQPNVKKENKMTPEYVAEKIVKCADTRSRIVYLPGWSYFSRLLQLIVPETIDSFAAKKYGFKFP
ncbi:hypothetical protein DFJ74DRAFT_669101 [Hyaloraphidium curvatum]|nr:hypothetical protein DFJ74DRAFT_669101 [Hyaloraphidium curvatum]